MAKQLATGRTGPIPVKIYPRRFRTYRYNPQYQVPVRVGQGKPKYGEKTKAEKVNFDTGEGLTWGRGLGP